MASCAPTLRLGVRASLEVGNLFGMCQALLHLACSPPLPLFPLCLTGAPFWSPSRQRLKPRGDPTLPRTSPPRRGRGGGCFPPPRGQGCDWGHQPGRAKTALGRETTPPNTPHAHCTSPKQPPGPLGSGRRSRAATPGAPASAGLEDRGVFATRRGTRVNPRAYFIIEPTNFVSQRLRSLPRACAAQLRPTPPSSFISCQQENKEIINRKLICGGGAGDSRGSHAVPGPGRGDGGGAAGRQAIATRPPRAGQPGAMGAVGKPPSLDGVGGYSNLYLITLK